jgi:hypothetical protein
MTDGGPLSTEMNITVVIPMSGANSHSHHEGHGDYQEKPDMKEGGSNGLPASHAGLSALLNAVTIQLNHTYEEKDTPKAPVDATTTLLSLNTDPVQKSDSNKSRHHETPKTTPTMVPEVAKKLPLPESLMTLLMDDSNTEVITFLPDGKFFALRSEDFSSRLMKQYFAVDTFESFIGELGFMGFTHIETDQPGIEVFRHRLFQKGDWKKCEELVRQVEKRNKDKSLYKASNRGNESLRDHCADRSDNSFKRRLSPAHAQKVIHSQSTSRKARVQHHFKTLPEAGINGPSDPVRLLRETSSEDYRSAARMIASEKILLHGQVHCASAQQSAPLEQQAVTDTTRTIVTDAIESLLRDEEHTRKTFRKHEIALSQASLPGLVSISKQLFCSSQGRKSDQPSAGACPVQDSRQGQMQKGKSS